LLPDDAVDPADPLVESCRVPRQVVVDYHIGDLDV
jgi:hypothetical protein